MPLNSKRTLFTFRKHQVHDGGFRWLLKSTNVALTSSRVVQAVEWSFKVPDVVDAGSVGSIGSDLWFQSNRCSVSPIRLASHRRRVAVLDLLQGNVHQQPTSHEDKTSTSTTLRYLHTVTCCCRRHARLYRTSRPMTGYSFNQQQLQPGRE